MLKEENNEKSLSADNVNSLSEASEARKAAASSLGEDFQPALPRFSQEVQAKAEQKETLSRISDEAPTPSLGQRPSTCVPWEKEEPSDADTSEAAGLLQEVAFLCHLAPACQQDSHRSAKNPSENQA